MFQPKFGFVAALALSLAGCGLAPSTLPSTDSAVVGGLSQPILKIMPTLPGTGMRRQATFFSYVAMDDHLTEFAENYLKAVQTTASPKVHDVAFADFEGPDNSYMFYLQPQADGQLSSPRSYLTPKTKEVTANDPANLAATLNWAATNYPSNFLALDIFAHGGGSIGFGTDETQVGKDQKFIMSIDDVGKALRSGLKGRKVQLINMLSCLMGNVEYAYELHDTAEVLIASEDSIMATPNTTEAFTAELNRELALPNPDARVLGRNMAIFGEAKNPESGYYTISAVDLSQMDGVRRAANVLTGTLLRAMPQHQAEILAAYDAVPCMTNSGWLGFNRDLWNFCNQLQQVRDAGVQASALDLKHALKAALLHTRDKEGAAANGLSICMPARGDEMTKMWNQPFFQARLNCRWAKDTGWNKFLEAVKKAS